MRIREALPGDAGLLTSIAQESKAHWGYPADALAAWRPQLTITRQDLIDHATRVAESDTEVVGFYVLGEQGADCTLEHLWVRPSWMHKGVGTMLLGHALQLAQDRRHAMVRVVSDPNAAEFYALQGGRPAGHVPAPLPDAPDRKLPVYEFTVAGADASHRHGAT